MALAAGVYASTNLDNLILLGSVAAVHPRKQFLVSGYLLASTCLLLACVGFSLLSLVVPVQALAYLGAVPLFMGLRMLARPSHSAHSGKDTVPSMWAVAILILANSLDTVAAFGPLYAESKASAVAGLSLGFAGAAALWLAVILKLASRLPDLSSWQRTLNYGPGVIMVVVGLYVLLDTVTDLQ